MPAGEKFTKKSTKVLHIFIREVLQDSNIEAFEKPKRLINPFQYRSLQLAPVKTSLIKGICHLLNFFLFSDAIWISEHVELRLPRPRCRCWNWNHRRVLSWMSRRHLDVGYEWWQAIWHQPALSLICNQAAMTRFPQRKQCIYNSINPQNSKTIHQIE